MKIATFNINNVNRRLPNLLSWLKTSRPDVACRNSMLRCNQMSAFGVIVLQNSFLGCVQIFPGALVRSLENYVGGHINSLISNRARL
jgi:hypothetical protein